MPRGRGMELPKKEEFEDIAFTMKSKTRNMCMLPRVSVVLVLVAAVLVSARGTTVHADPVLTLSVNQTTFGPGDTLHVGLHEDSPGADVMADWYFGILLPDGVTLFFFTSLSPLNGVLTRVDADPQSFPPLIPNMIIPSGVDVTREDIFVFTFSGNEPLGTYVLFTLLTVPGAFADGRVDAGDILVLDTKPFTTTPTSPPTTSTTTSTIPPTTSTVPVSSSTTSTIPPTSTVPSTTTSSTTTSTMPPTTSTIAPPTCCKVCTTGKPCGDTCIAKSDTCHVGPGCAC